jgi:Fe-S-cluster containining protein
MSDTKIPKKPSILELLEQIDSAVSAVAARFPDEFRCRKGCSDCCHAAFDISLAEAVLIMEHFNLLGRKTRRDILKRAKHAKRRWEDALNARENLSLIRIACPLLSPDDQCLLYDVRPVNCRTYGAPTEIEGKGHVCSLSGFASGRTYPTVRLHLIQNSLLELSLKINAQIAMNRWPIANVLLRAIDYQLPAGLP